jgi:6-phosphogluconate dehydrogenase (decarboxylating)
MAAWRSISAPPRSRHWRRTAPRAAASVTDLVAKLPAPRVVWMMIPAAAVDALLQTLLPVLKAGDIVIDGGNSHYADDMRREQELKSRACTTSMSVPAAVCGAWSAATA